MAVISMAKNLIYNLSRTFPQSSSALSLRYSPRKVSRVSFVTASKFSQGRNAAEENKGGSYEDVKWTKEERGFGSVDVGRDSKETMGKGLERSKQKAEEMKNSTQDYAQDTNEKTKGMAETAAEKAKEGTRRASETAETAADRAKDYAPDAKEKTKDMAGTVAEKAKQGTHKAAGTAEDVKDKAKENAWEMKEKTEGAAGTVVDKVKEGTGKAAETVKGTAKGAWESLTETGETIKEAVAGAPDEEVGVRVSDDSDTDAEVELHADSADLRRRTGGKPDVKKQH